jgi:hypothetical protein
MPLPFFISCLCVVMLARLLRWNDASASTIPYVKVDPFVAQETKKILNCTNE